MHQEICIKIHSTRSQWLHVSTSLEAKEHLATSDREHVFLFTLVSVPQSLLTADTFLFLARTYMCNTHKCFSKGNVSSAIGAHENEDAI